jgi:hypothetical protein
MPLFLVMYRLSQFWGMKSLVRSSFQISQDYYPETMGRLLVVNAPSSFTAIWTVVKPWLAKETVKKIDILGSNYKSVLLDVVEKDNLPEQFGGKCNCAGEGGCEVSSEGPWMDERRRRRGEEGPGVGVENNDRVRRGEERNMEVNGSGRVDEVTVDRSECASLSRESIEREVYVKDQRRGTEADGIQAVNGITGG